MALVEDLERAIDALAGADAFSISDAESVVALERLGSRLDCLIARSASAFDSAGEWALDGAQNAASWLATECHLPPCEAKSQLRRGRALRNLPLCAEALAQGSIGVAQFDALAKAAAGPGPHVEATFRRDEAVLVHVAQELKFSGFTRALALWSQMADPDGADASDLERQARRRVYLVESLDGMYLGGMHLDPISGAIVSGELGRLERALFETDWEKAKKELGREPQLSQLCRSSAQRCADALVEMATRSRTAPADGRRPEPLFSVTVDYPSLHGRICQLEGGHSLSVGTLLPWLDGASFERIVFSQPTRIECSVTARFFTGATRRAIALRDQQCAHEYCEKPQSECQIDHIIPYGQGGLTTQDNGRVLCSFHNRRRNHHDDEDGRGGGAKSPRDGPGGPEPSDGPGGPEPSDGPGGPEPPGG